MNCLIPMQEIGGYMHTIDDWKKNCQLSEKTDGSIRLLIKLFIWYCIVTIVVPVGNYQKICISLQQKRRSTKIFAFKTATATTGNSTWIKETRRFPQMLMRTVKYFQFSKLVCMEISSVLNRETILKGMPVHLFWHFII